MLLGMCVCGIDAYAVRYACGMEAPVYDGIALIQPIYLLIQPNVCIQYRSYSSQTNMTLDVSEQYCAKRRRRRELRATSDSWSNDSGCRGALAYPTANTYFSHL